MKRKRIAFYVKMFLVGGIETSLVEYLNHLDSNMYEVTLIIGINMYQYQNLLDRINNSVKIIYIVDNKNLSKVFLAKKTGKLPLFLKIYDEIFLKLVRYYLLNIKLIKLLNTFDIVIDYAINIHHLMKKIVGKKTAFFHFSLKEHYYKNHSKFKQIKHNLKCYDKVITLSQYMLEDLKEFNLNINTDVLPNQFNFNRIYKLANTHAVIKYSNYILSIGRLEENQKDFTNLIKAYKILKEQHSIKQKLLIIGEGSSRNYLQSLIDSLNLTSDVLLLGKKSNPMPWLRVCSVFVLSSKFEGFGNVIVEAMILARPVVVSCNRGGPNEILDNGNNGILISPHNDILLAQSIIKIITDDLLSNTIIKNATNNLYRYNIENNISKINQILC